MRLTAGVIDLVKRHEQSLHTYLDDTTTAMTSKKDKIHEFLLTFADEFDLSADIVEPGMGYTRGQALKRFKPASRGRTSSLSKLRDRAESSRPASRCPLPRSQCRRLPVPRQPPPRPISMTRSSLKLPHILSPSIASYYAPCHPPTVHALISSLYNAPHAIMHTLPNNHPRPHP